ncbi:MAG: OmpA family protein [Spirochaetales bacterium]
MKKMTAFVLFIALMISGFIAGCVSTEEAVPAQEIPATEPVVQEEVVEVVSEVTAEISEIPDFSNIQFQADSAVLTQTELSKLNQIAAVLKNLPVVTLTLTGYTALSGTEAEQLELSEHRARAVADYLIQLNAVTESRIVIQALGAAGNIAPNDSEVNKSQNRRVEITVSLE